MSIVTKTGDDGKSRWQGKIVDKDSQLLTAIGDIDELMAVIQVTQSKVKKSESQKLKKIVDDLYQIMGDLAYEVRFKNYNFRIKQLEKDIKKMENELPKLSQFITFENELGAWLNWSRTVARRAERSTVALVKKQMVDKNILIYLNRLSDYLFMLSRIKK